MASPRWLGLVLLAGFSLPVSGAWAQPPIVSEVTLNGMKGEVLDDATLAHGTFMVVLWATWSPRSRDIVSRVDELVRLWPAFKVITVDFEEDRPAIDAFLKGRAMQTPVFLDLDGTFAKKYALATLPGLLVLRDGGVLYRGQLPANPESVLTPLLQQ
jgi:thiol-disulfide isomerase/thioredoxin